tara:strand:- start:331 stop:468 length:138 start_codon:yes stop_codon:yes gene_type:complete
MLSGLSFEILCGEYAFTNAINTSYTYRLELNKDFIEVLTSKSKEY